jgi:hypothetical protein
MSLPRTVVHECVRLHPSIEHLQVVDVGTVSNDQRFGIDNSFEIRAFDVPLTGIATDQDEKSGDSAKKICDGAAVKLSALPPLPPAAPSSRMRLTRIGRSR